MAKPKGLSLKSHKLKGQSAWWYEEPWGISVCCEHVALDGGKHVQIVKIRWASLQAALRRKGGE